MVLSSTGESILAIAGCLIGGVMNSTWPQGFRLDGPSRIRVVKPGGWDWEHGWLVFTIIHNIVNCVYCLAALGPHMIKDVYSSASGTDVGLVCMFGFLWGSGAMLYSVGIQLLGAGLGIALQMSLLVILGTLLPLIRDYHDEAGSAAAVVTYVGLVLGILGFSCSAYSSKLKEDAFNTAVKRARSDRDLLKAAAASANSLLAVEGRAAVAGKSEMTASVQDSNGVYVAKKQRVNYKVGVLICAVGAVMSSMLQFAFVFGQSIIDNAEDSFGVSDILSPLFIWFLAFPTAGVWNVMYACHKIHKNKSWGRYRGTTCLQFAQMCFISVLFVGHIHLYGTSQALFGNLGTVVAWPLIMSSTVLCGQVWGVILKEWRGASKAAIHANICSICLLISSVTVIAIAGSVL